MAANQTSMKELNRQAKQQPVKQMGGESVSAFFEGNRKAIEAALPKHMNADRMLKVALHAIRTTPALMECNTASLMGAVIQCSQLGLEPNTVLGHAYLVPFWNGREKRKEVQIIPGYKGLIDLARRSGQIQTIYAQEVYQADHFRLQLGTNPCIEHEPTYTGDRGEIVGFYAVAQMKDGGYQFEFMPTDEVLRIRDGSQGYQNAIKYKKDHPWISRFVPMGRKSAIRKLSKFLPLSIEFATGAALDGQAEGGQSQALGDVLDGEYTPRATNDDEPPAEAGAETSPEPEEQEAAADPYIERMEDAAHQDALDEVMAEAGDLLEGAQKARATKAYQRNRQRLEGDTEQGEPSARGMFDN